MNDCTTDSLAELVRCMAGDVVGGPRKTIRISPDGVVASRKGTFLLDQQGADQIIAAFNAHRNDIPIDFEHSTARPHAPGEAKAAGWIKALSYEPGRGLLAEVEWNASAREAIRAGEYAYISPVLYVKGEPRRAVALHSAGLTNHPAIPAMDRLVASEDGDQSGKPGDRTAERLLGTLEAELRHAGANLPSNATRERVLLAALGVAERGLASLQRDAESQDDEDGRTPDQIMDAIAAAMRAKRDGITEGASREQILAAVLALVEAGGSKKQANADTDTDTDKDAAAEPDREAVFAMLDEAAKKLGITKESRLAKLAAVLATIIKTQEGEGEPEDRRPAEAVASSLLPVSNSLPGADCVNAARRDDRFEHLIEPFAERRGGFGDVGRLRQLPREDRMALVALSELDAKSCTRIMGRVYGGHFPQGRTSPPEGVTTTRTRTIRDAVRNYQDDPRLSVNTSIEAYVSLDLQDAGFPRLVENELIAFV